MAESSIQWTDCTWVIVQGCDYVSPGCKNCYAVNFVHRHSFHKNEKISLPVAGLTHTANNQVRWTGKIKMRADRLDEPRKVKKGKRWFVPSLGDIFHELVEDEFLLKIFQVMHDTPQHTYQVLTKRPWRMRDFSRELCIDEMRGKLYISAQKSGRRWLPHAKNVWLGVSAESQAWADKRLPVLMQCLCSLRFASFEPQLGPIDARPWLASEYDKLAGDPGCSAPHLLGRAKLDWGICGGESGRQPRPFDVAWARDLVRQFGAAGVPFFMKQLGARAVLDGQRYKTLDVAGGTPEEWPADIRVRQFPGQTTDGLPFAEIG